VPAKNPRVNVVLERPLYEALRQWAREEGVSLSMKVRDLVKRAVDERLWALRQTQGIDGPRRTGPGSQE